jgi:hypothetical protein
MKRCSPFLLVLALLGSLVFTGAAAAAATSSGPQTSRLAVTVPILSGSAFEESEDEFEEEEGEEFETEECEAGFEEEELFGEIEEEEEFEEEEFEFEEEGCEEATSKGGANGTVTAPPACLVRRAESTITTLPSAGRVDLTVHYATWSPAAVSIGLALKDGKGRLGLEHATKHFGLGGTLHLSTKLGDGVMDRAARAREFDISLRAAKTPAYCANVLEQQLKTSKPVGPARVYSDAHGHSQRPSHDH